MKIIFTPGCLRLRDQDHLEQPFLFLIKPLKPIGTFGKRSDAADQRGAINVDPLISSVAPLSEGASWFQRLYQKEKGLLKVILVP